MLGIQYTLPQIAQLFDALDFFQGSEKQFPIKQVAFDTRSITYGAETLFVPLKTSHRDGHDFIEAAMEKGVCNFFSERVLPYKNINYLLVNDSLDALQRWAAAHRRLFTYPVIGITGSNGKTIVKEWLTTLLEAKYQVVKSPMSYNSQLGVAISLLQMREGVDFAIIEAGISQRGEMAILAEMIQPTLGILTHTGKAHAENFSSLQEKIAEKSRLFASVEELFLSAYQPENEDFLLHKPAKLHFYSLGEIAVPAWMQTPANTENLAAATAVAQKLGMTDAEIQARIPLLRPVQMRTEIISDNPEITVINDSYNSDPDSVLNAFLSLANTNAFPSKKVILSDLEHLGERQEAIQSELLTLAEQQFGAENVFCIGKVFSEIRASQTFLDTEHFLRQIDYKQFKQSVVLLKGARRYELEKILPLLNQKLNTTTLKINLNALVHNLRYLRSLVPKWTKVMGMVKAFSYGSGTWEIAQTLEREGVDYLAVAYTSEAIELREKGIRCPIMVMNPDEHSLTALALYNAEPEIYSFSLLEKYIQAARLAGLSTYPLHLKWDTGMGRLGFSEKDIPRLVEYLQQFPDIQVLSMLTHLAAADEPNEADFTQQQFERFRAIATILEEQTGIRPLLHAQNSAGVIRYPDQNFSMVRLGIGLYGTNPCADIRTNLVEIGTLQTSISQIHVYPAGTSIGYSRSQFTERDSRIATIPIGYADGIFRSLSNGKGHFYVKGKPAPIVGRVCMDMIMLDITDIPEAEEGDEVLIFGRGAQAFQSVSKLAADAGTIAYELLTRISPRVPRIYVREDVET